MISRLMVVAISSASNLDQAIRCCQAMPEFFALPKIFICE